MRGADSHALPRPQFFFADDTDRYEWALISGGPPNIPTETGCRTRENTSNESGLWIFARVQFPDPALIEDVRQIAKDAGFDTSVLNKVEHNGCTYNSTMIERR